MNNNFIARTTKTAIADSLLNNAVILDGEFIQDKTDLLNPFYTKFHLNDYIWTYSLDTFYDIFSDKDFINEKIVTIIISNFDKLLSNDIERKRLFIDTLVNLIIYSEEIEYKIYIVV